MKKLFFLIPCLVLVSSPIMAESKLVEDFKNNKRDKTEAQYKKNCMKYKKARKLNLKNELKDIKNDINLIKNSLEIS
tara:strand:+ start:647 stop:877 length:231 start_codon:yes stop_codon:yes gene_type:complete